ncbi:MAG TPA: ABC transporter substrate-binding protein [Candidatus Limnocylindrales bacterium]
MPVSSFPRRLAGLATMVAVVAGACGSGSSSATPGASAAATFEVTASPAGPGSPGAPSASAAPTRLVVGLGYIPSVQFAPFYLADQAGYYADAGLSVEFQNKIDPDLITLVGQGALDIGIGDGTSVIPAASQGIPVKYIATLYGQFPDIVFAKASSGITTAADLKGRKIGTPGRYGGGWIMLQALLGSAGLTTSDVDIVEYPDFTQRAAVEQGAVDAATGFSNNEPVQLELDGSKAVVLHIDQITPLPGPGLIAAAKTLTDKHDAVARFVAATLRAMNAIRLNPQVGLDAAIKTVPELGSARDAQLAILTATIDSWTGPVQQANGLGALDRDGWAKSIAYLTTLGLVPTPVTVGDLLVDGFIPVGG